MEKKEYNCTECGTSNFITLLGSKEVVFKKKCNSCQIELEMTLDENEKLSIKPIEKKEKGLNKKKRFRIDDIEIDIEEGISKIKKEDDKSFPSDYPIYEEEINGENRELLGEVKESERTDIKFQTSIPEDHITLQAKKANYQKLNTNKRMINFRNTKTTRIGG